MAEGKITEEYIRLLVGKNLKRLRALQNVSQLNLALGADLAHNFINDIENCKKGISAKTLAKLSSALNAEPYQFFLPENLPDNFMQLYLRDFSDSLAKMVGELTESYLPQKNKKKGGEQPARAQNKRRGKS
ncbi:MAG: helix-turn-helix domain-containing protein [Treponema sp.]|jgi:transcriptional regulator with XRE-family HTH domain|nr:helix-turn-helix domain-containing protein [Treponema sp.]